MNRLLYPAYAVALIVATVGCNTATQPQYGDLGLVNVTGVVTLDAKPLAGVTLEFVTEADQTYSYGYTDAAGQYSLMFDSRTPGTIPGPKAIRVRIGKPAGTRESGASANEAASETAFDDPDAPAASDAADVPSCYRALGKLGVNVPERNCSVNVDLTTDCASAKAVVAD